MRSPGRRAGGAAAVALALLLSVALVVLVAPPPSSATSASASARSSAAPLPPALGDGPEWAPFLGSHPVWCTMSNPGWSGCQGHHPTPALDIGMPVGTPVRAAGPGVVHLVDTAGSGAGGLYVVVAHTDGRYSRYLHLSRIDVVPGQSVLRGQQLGLSGDTGSATAPHLHYDEQQPLGTRVDPGPMYGLVGGSVVAYPATFGQASWWTVVYGSLLRNDGFPGVFLDVPDDHPFAADIRWAVDTGIAFGYPGGTFKPAQVVSRQELVAMLHRLVGSPQGPFADPGFSDVPADHPFALPIAWAAEVGLARGYPDGRFGALDPVTRGSAAAFFHRLARAPADPFPDPGFVDVPADHTFAHEIAWMAQSGITQGFPDNTYRPAVLVDRQSAAAFTHRAAR